MKTETETKEAGGEFSEIEVKSDVETVREADEDHLGHRTQANEEEGSIVLHAGNDMDEKDKIAISKVKIAMEYRREETNGEQTENVIETECLGEKIEKRQRRYGKKKQMMKNSLCIARKRTRRQVLSYSMSVAT